MSKVLLSAQEQLEQSLISPGYVRISMAAAIALGLKSGRIYRDAHCGCINLLQNYPEGCYANCSYCGLARERPGTPEDNSFIRVSWPLFATDLVAEKIAEHESRIGRVCISQVQDHRANADLLDIARRVRSRCAVPMSALVSATLMDELLLRQIKDAGVDIIGIGLDAATETLFYQTRGRAVKSPHDWARHWRIIRAARRLYGPYSVNCHIIVGLGETDRELIDLFYQLKAEQIAGYLFSFNPEPGTALQDAPRAPLHRLRRIQLVKYLIENIDLARSAICFDSQGSLDLLLAPATLGDVTLDEGRPFMTNGCPDKSGVMACNRPYGSYRPGEPFRDYPFRPNPDDLATIRAETRLAEILPH